MTSKEKEQLLKNVIMRISCYSYICKINPTDTQSSAELKKAKNDLKSLEGQKVSV